MFLRGGGGVVERVIPALLLLLLLLFCFLVEELLLAEYDENDYVAERNDAFYPTVFVDDDQTMHVASHDALHHLQEVAGEEERKRTVKKGIEGR